MNVVKPYTYLSDSEIQKLDLKFPPIPTPLFLHHIQDGLIENVRLFNKHGYKKCIQVIDKTKLDDETFNLVITHIATVILPHWCVQQIPSPYDNGFESVYYYFIKQSILICNSEYEIHSGISISFDGEYTKIGKLSNLKKLESINITLCSSFEGNPDLAIHCHKMS